jgi:diguanylate cyclase (GGDEF)-like protein/PAS domain S-box-containing protein
MAADTRAVARMSSTEGLALAQASEEQVARVPVLVVDDNAGKRLALASVLSPLGYSIVEADSGLAALRCVTVQDFAVILLDVKMPITDGFETAALIRQRQQSEMTPIIFITASRSDEIDYTDLYAEGAVDFIFAPVPPAELRAKVSVFAKLFIQAGDLAAQAREVQATADQLRLLTDAAPIGIFQTDAQNVYSYTNPRWTELTGITPEMAAGQPWDFIIATEERASLVASYPDGALDRAERSHRFEIPIVDAPPRIVLMTSEPIPDGNGGISGWVGTLADMTAEAGKEAAQSDARDELTAIARMDSLTGLGNRRALKEDLDLLEARVTRYGHRYCIALFDVDHFKSYNDTYGHQEGDEALRVVATQLKEQARGGDALYRYGGEEFLCVFPEQSLTSGTKAVQRMRASIEALAIPHAGVLIGVLTISAGLAMIDPSRIRSAAEVLKEADDALYRAKLLGRNRVEQATPSAVAEPALANTATTA